MKIVDGTKENFEKEVLQANTKVLVDFNADWCGPCKMIGPVLKEISEEKENIKIVSINIDNEEDLAEEYNVYSIPCLVLIKDGKETDRLVGFRNKDDLIKWIDEK